MLSRQIIAMGMVATLVYYLVAAVHNGGSPIQAGPPPSAPAPPASHPRRRTNTPPPVANPSASTGAETSAPQAGNTAANAVGDVNPAKQTGARPAASAMPPLPVRKPKPRPPTTPEGIFRAGLDALIAPVLATELSKDDSVSLIAALTAIKKSNLQSAKTVQAKLTDPAAVKLVDWYRLRLGFGKPTEFAAFLNANPAWPDRKTLIARAEEQAFVGGGTAGSIMAYFKQFPPRTGAGYAAMASAHLAQNNKAMARKFALKAWRDLSMATTLESGFITRFGPLLSPADHRWRIDRLLMNDSRYRSTRKRRAAKVRRLIPLLPDRFERQKATARRAVYLRQRSAAKLMAALAKPRGKNATKSSGENETNKGTASKGTTNKTPAKPARKNSATGNTGGNTATTGALSGDASSGASAPDNNAATSRPAANKAGAGNTAATIRATKPVAAVKAVKQTTDWGVEFARAQLLRRQKKYAAAWKILLAAPDDPVKLVSPDDWWKEKRAGVYEALNAGKTKIAFQLASNPGPISVNPRKDAAFLAGWIAYRLMNDHKTAAKYFQLMRDSADGPLSASKANYWLARALQSSDPAAAATARRAAATFNHTFHGQLARQVLDPDGYQITIQTPLLPTKAQAETFNTMDAVKAAVIATKAGLRFGIRRAFFNHLRYNLPKEADMIMLAHLAQSLGDTQMSVRIGKTGVVHKQNLYYYSYPVHPLPDYNPLRKPPEKAILLGVARQESEFNTQIRSGAGARGILQVMPITARHICADYKIKCRISRLITDHTYNTMIGSAYLADRMDDFAGSYVLTLSGYNAGPGRTRQWIRRFGDPRDPNANTLDWIERIPFTETRKYVMKVLSNVQVYRARLGNTAKPLRLLDDLARGKRGRSVPNSAATNN